MKRKISDPANEVKSISYLSPWLLSLVYNRNFVVFALASIDSTNESEEKLIINNELAWSRSWHFTFRLISTDCDASIPVPNYSSCKLFGPCITRGLFYLCESCINNCYCETLNESGSWLFVEKFARKKNKILRQNKLKINVWVRDALK